MQRGISAIAEHLVSTLRFFADSYFTDTYRDCRHLGPRGNGVNIKPCPDPVSTLGGAMRFPSKSIFSVMDKDIDAVFSLLRATLQSL